MKNNYYILLPEKLLLLERYHQSSQGFLGPAGMDVLTH